MFLVLEVQEKFKPALCDAIQNGSYQSHHWKQKSWQEPILVVLWFHLFVGIFLMEITSISWISTIHVTFNWHVTYPKQNACNCGSLDHLTSLFDKAKISESRLQAWPWKPFRMISRKYLAFAQSITVLHENFQKLSETGNGGGGGAARPSGPYAYAVFIWSSQSDNRYNRDDYMATWLYTKNGNRQRRLHANQA